MNLDDAIEEMRERDGGTEYSCRPLPDVGPNAFEIRIDFDMWRWFEGRPTMGVRVLYRSRLIGGGLDAPDRVEIDAADVLSSIRAIEARCECLQ